MLYHLALFIHILGAFVSFAAAAVEITAISRLRRAKTRVDVAAWSWLHHPTELAHRIGGPMLLLSGLAMEGLTWGWTQGWINVSIAALIAIAATGATQIAPRLAQIDALVTAPPQGPASAEISAELAARLADPALARLGPVLTGSALAVTWVMVARPEWPVALGTVVLGCLAGILAGRAAAK